MKMTTWMAVTLGLSCVSACSSSNDTGSAATSPTPSTTGNVAGSSGASTAGATGGGATFSIFPTAVYSGFDGTNTYRAPVIVHPAQTGTAVWTLADPTIASVTVDGSNATFTTRKAGETTITVTINGKTATAPFKVYAYTKQQYDAGANRYMHEADSMNPACISCHGMGAQGPDHTPTEIDADTDEEIQNTFTTGVDPEGRKIKDMPEFADLLKGYSHMWKVTPDEKVGLLAYLRALMPHGYPEYDAPTAEK